MRYGTARQVRLVDVYVDHRCIATYPTHHAPDAECIQAARRALEAQGLVCPVKLRSAAFRVRCATAEALPLGPIQAAND